MTEYLKTKSEKTCYGCRACEQVCPHGAILMMPDDEGFLYPLLDGERCTDCGLCEKVCPYEDESRANAPICVFAAQSSNINSLMESSSGGAFSVLSDYILEQGGYVCGCIFDGSFTAIHTVTNEKSVTEKMRGSKYVQSDVKNTFSEIKKLLDENKKVLFTGTPCQVDGLKCYLLKDYENLYTADLICHGVPSPRLLSDYLETVRKKHGEVTELIFRDKKRHGWSERGTIKYNEKSKTIEFSNNSYYNLYLQDAVSRKCCYECKYARTDRVGDITLGDFWGAENVIPNIKAEKGVSAVLVNTDKGKSLFNAVKDKITLTDATLKSVADNNGNLTTPSKMPKKREKIYHRIEKDGYLSVAKAECHYQYIKPILRKIIPKSLKKTIKNLLRGRK